MLSIGIGEVNLFCILVLDRINVIVAFNTQFTSTCTGVLGRSYMFGIKSEAVMPRIHLCLHFGETGRGSTRNGSIGQYA